MQRERNFFAKLTEIKLRQSMLKYKEKDPRDRNPYTNAYNTGKTHRIEVLSTGISRLEQSEDL